MVINRPPDLPAADFRIFIIPFPVSAVSVEFPEDKAVLAPLHQIHFGVLRHNRAGSPDGLIGNLMAAAHTAPRLVMAGLTDCHFFFTERTISCLCSFLTVLVKDIIFPNTDFIYPAFPVFG